VRVLEHAIHVAGRVFVEGAYTHAFNLETLASVPFAMQTLVTKQRKRIMKI